LLFFYTDRYSFFQLEKKFKVILTINLFPQIPRALKRNHLPWRQDHIITGSRIPTFTFILFPNTELAEPGNQHILTGCQGAFDNF